jgi:hypothetical protein
MYPDLDLETKGAVERVEAENNILRSQVDNLRASNIQLMEEQVSRAALMAQKSMKYYGLTLDQNMAVKKYADNLRKGDDKVPESGGNDKIVSF